MDLVEKSFKLLFPERKFSYTTQLKYSGRFNGYNANIVKSYSQITVKASRLWMGISEDIKIGLVQSLLCKLFNKKKKSFNIDLYNHFIKIVHTTIPKTHTHPLLSESFDELNDKFFNGLLEKPNLKLSKGVKTLGYYDYHSDMICISEHLLKNQRLLEYVLYHEMLHKKLKFECNGSRTIHHSAEFKRLERRFCNHDQLEKELQGFVRSLGTFKRKKKLLSPFQEPPG